jgi:hypothetical protein
MMRGQTSVSFLCNLQIKLHRAINHLKKYERSHGVLEFSTKNETERARQENPHSMRYQVIDLYRKIHSRPYTVFERGKSCYSGAGISVVARRLQNFLVPVCNESMPPCWIYKTSTSSHKSWAGSICHDGFTY